MNADCWDDCLLACHRESYELMCDTHYEQIVGGAA